MTPLDRYVHSQVEPMLEPGEQIYYAAHVRRQPGLFWQIFLIGGLLLMLMTKVYFAVLTSRRLILIRTKGGFWAGTPRELNLGVEQYDVRSFTKVTVSGFANNRAMTFHSQASKTTLRISPWSKAVSQTKDFLEQVPNLINSGQLASGQLRSSLGPGAPPPQPQYGAPPAQYGAPQPQYGAPPAQYGAPQPQYGAPPAQYGAPPPQYGAPPTQPQYGAPPAQYGAPPAQYGAPPTQPQYGGPPSPLQYGAPPPLAPGARVMVLAHDGQRYAGTLVQLQGEHCLCAMPNGKFWFSVAHVTWASP
jgi:hypothetical protein